MPEPEGRSCGLTRRAASAGAKARPSRERACWSSEATRKSNALDLEPNVFTLDDAREIARSLKRSAQASDRRKSEPFRSAMSMLNFYINRAGKGLSKARRQILENAKIELRREFGRL